jgi:hypothetical protein
MKCGSASPTEHPLLIDFCRPSKFKEEALGGTVWRTHIGRGYESFTGRQQNRMNQWTAVIVGKAEQNLYFISAVCSPVICFIC